MDKQKKESVVIAVTMKQDVINRIDTLALKMGIKPSRLIVNFISIGLDEYKVLKKEKILKNCIFVFNLLEQYGIFGKKTKEDEIKSNRAVNVTVRVSKDFNDEIDKWAIETKRTRNKLIESCIESSLEAFNFFQATGIFTISMGMIKIENNFQEVWEKKIKKKWNDRFKKAKNIGKEMFDIDIDNK